MYCCNYDVVDANGKKHEIRKGACYGGWFSRMHSAQSVTVYVLKDYSKVVLPNMYGKKGAAQNYSGSSKMTFTSEQVREYVRLLTLMGFNIDFSEVDGHDFETVV